MSIIFLALGLVVFDWVVSLKQQWPRTPEYCEQISYRVPSRLLLFVATGKGQGRGLLNGPIIVRQQNKNNTNLIHHFHLS